jgi:predicted esterase YcpF (UPF0227 family)
LYLHGFRSSPKSFKARVVHQRMAQLGRAQQLICPQLPASPKAAMELVLGLVERHAAQTGWPSSAPRWAAFTRPGWPSASAAARC